ncbi:MAG: glycosyltransferase family 2 protein [Myxococcales bacterium]|nr:glycosyltransferase family 2 protein [Myxococcales bacterium]
MPELSVIVPLHNERPVLPQFLAELTPVLQGLDLPYEVLLVDDGSSDGTADAADALAHDDPHLCVIRLTRNFGKEAAMAAGLSAAAGRAAILMDGDLQHPVSVVPQLVAAWRDGAEVVNAVKEARGREGVAYRLSAWAFNRLMGAALRHDFDRESDFKLLDRSVIDVIASLPERTRFFRGLVAWVGFRTAQVPFAVAPRAGGHTSWSPLGLVTYSVRNLVSFTSLPLRLVAATGFVVTGLGMLLGAQTLWTWARGLAVDGFSTTILSVLIMGGFQLLALGVVSLYLSAIYEEVKQRPLFVVRKPEPPDSEDRSGPVA